MKTMFGILKVTLGVALLGAVFASLAFLSAACGSVNGQAAPDPPQAAATPEPVVGFWYIKLTAEDNGPNGPPDGTVIDWGYQQWHSDGTEILNSGSGPKRFCLGVWVKGTGPSKYEINHFPIDYPDGTTVNIINIRETITLSNDQGSMTGTFTLDVYDAGGNLLQHIAGNVEGHRITSVSSVQDVLPPTP
jgi:hypothetical protein